jgi:RNA polymerase sigma-70 factor (ECF subfamily)
MTAPRRATLTVVPKRDETAWRDRELGTALMAKDPTAAVIAYRRFAPRVFGIVQRAMGPGADAEDVTQDIFLRVFARIHTLRDPDALGSFVLSVALRVIKWQLRQRRVRRILNLTDDGHVPEGSNPGLDSEAREALRKFYGLMEQLPVNQRTVFSLRQIEGMDLQEIADAVGVSRATVKRRLSRARDRLINKIRLDSALKAYVPGRTSNEA